MKSGTMFATRFSVLQRVFIAAKIRNMHLFSLCNDPDSAFAFERDLATHSRAKDGLRNQVRMCVGDTIACPSCKTKFGEKVSALAHSSDTRRPNGRKFVIREWAPIFVAECAEFDERAGWRGLPTEMVVRT